MELSLADVISNLLFVVLVNTYLEFDPKSMEADILVGFLRAIFLEILIAD